MNKIIVNFLVCCSTFGIGQTVNAQHHHHSLNGQWQFQREGAGDSWKAVALPNSFESHEGDGFDGVGIYKKTIEPIKLPDGARALLHFQAVATEAEFWFDGQKIGSHLGGWTPFRFDVTDLINANPNKPHQIRIRVDEKVGHNSQGFLPVFAPHFGGIWQSVKLIVVQPCWIDDLGIMAIGNPDTGRIQLKIPFKGELPRHDSTLQLRFRLHGTTHWSDVQSLIVKLDTNRTMDFEFPIPNWKIWSPTHPDLYEFQFQLQPKISIGVATGITPRSTVTTRAAFRSIAAQGEKLLLNGSPLVVRGVLNWGYAPPRVAPSIDEQHFRNELELARSHGFNLMKFCLWIPPKRYLEIADEVGMLTWIEYPTWHSKWTPDQLPRLQKEFSEFFRNDRNHPSVILRSLTCETGPSADLEVIRALYDRCHDMIPGSIVEDDSSWIAWNRIHDFYDDHPYGNNHTWVETLDRLKSHIKKHGPKPLVLGESIAADTWTDNDALIKSVGDRRPFWLPNYLDGNLEWTALIRKMAGESGLENLDADSKRYALLMRKYQIEAFRREVPYGGYVVSVIRDFPFASMGLIDFLDRPKWSPRDWNWHRDTMLLLATEADRRSFVSGSIFPADLLISHFSDSPIAEGKLDVTIERIGDDIIEVVAHTSQGNIDQPAGSLVKAIRLEMSLPSVDRPTQMTVRATLRTGNAEWSNDWQIWVFPSAEKPQVALHESIKNGALAALFDDCGAAAPINEVVVTRRLDGKTIDFLEAGGNVLVIPDGKKSSFPLSDEWFLRGAPFIPDHPILESVPREMLIELQHFDLASSVVPDIGYLDQIDPILMLWHNHDINRVKTHGLIFETQVGKGRLLISAVRHTSDTNAVGRWLLSTIVNHLQNGPAPVHSLADDSLRQLREKVSARKIELVTENWHFKPDPENNGLANEWERPTTIPDATWKPIRIGRSWEGQNYPNLDGWAWYRIDVDLPESWQELPVYISTEGVDDHYELYVNGQFVGSGGEIDTRKTAFEERASHDVTKFVKPGEPVTIAFRVFDWYGAGGIHRPVTISTTRLGTGIEILK